MISKLLCLALIFSFGLIGLSCRKLARLQRSGGMAFTVEIETDAANRDAIVEQAIRITEKKLEAIETDGEVARIPGADNRISVKIYEPRDLEKLKKFLFTSYRLELKKIVSTPYPAPVETYTSEESARQKAIKDQEVLPYPERGNSALQRFVIVEKDPIVTGEDVRTAKAYSKSGANRDFSIGFALKPEGAVKLAQWTRKNINSYIAVILDGEVQSAAFIKSEITDSGEISGRFTKEEAENIALSLQSGYLPATMKVIEEKTLRN
jgi:preprotein translocase subunit SecD